jgi:hypothetical protein
MDFLDPKKRRAHHIRLVIGYGLMAIALGFGTLILVFATSGYGIDRKTGTIIKNGLVFVSAHPESAKIYINGQDRGSTDGRFVLEEGKYNFALKRDGYRDWTHDVMVEGVSVERLVYPFLFPSKLTSSDVQLYAAAPDMVTQSPDRHWIVSHQAANFNSFEVTDASTDTNDTTTATLPTSVMPAKTGTQKLEAVEWSTDNRHVLLKHSFAEGSEYIMFDREVPAESINITQALGGRQLAQLALRDKKPDQVYVHQADGVLQAFDLKSRAVTPVATKVLSFWPYGDKTILYVTDADAPAGKVYAKLRQDTTSYTVRTLPKSDTYLLNMAEFDGDQYVAIGTKAESRLYIYLNPLSKLKASPTQLPPVKVLLKVDSGAEFASFSANARFIAIQSSSKFAIYDAETNRQFRYDQKIVVDAGREATWMDGHRLNLVANDGKLHIFDFDGTNHQTLLATLPAFTPFFDRDYTALFTVSPSVTVKDKTALVRTELVVKKD